MRLSWTLALAVLTSANLFAQISDGEIRFSVTDVTNRGLSTTILLKSSSNSLLKSLSTNPSGSASFQHLPYGKYQYTVSRLDFVTRTGTVDLHSPLPVDVALTLEVGSVETTVNVEDRETLLDTHQVGSESTIGRQQITERNRTSPGRSIPDLITSQPGWLLEANGVVHPRGSEYQVQYVVDGLPLTENRSPSFAPPFDTDDVQSLHILTGSYPAEFGRKLGGVVAVTTSPDTQKGWHGSAIVGGGSFASVYSYLNTQYASGPDVFGLSAEVERTDRYLDPPVLENFTNSATTDSFSGRYQRDFDADDRLSLSFTHSEARFMVPNELTQQDAGQRQDRRNRADELHGRYQHILSPNLLFSTQGLYQNVSANLYSNVLSTPIAAFQDRGFNQGYINAGFTGQNHSHNWKAGADFLYSALRESFSYNITDPSFFDPDTPLQFAFNQHAPDREGSLYAQDVYRFHNLNVSAGLRWDSYHLLVSKNAWSPRIGASFYWPWAKLLLHASYDRAFQTPAIENLLLASSAEVTSLNDQVLRLPVKPSHGNFYETGISRVLATHLRLDVNWFHRAMTDFADDDVLLNTGVSFPIAFSRAEVTGTEVKLEMPRWGRFSGFASYSNQAGTGYLPVTGGLFLGNDAAGQVGSSSSFPITQDQRNTAAAQVRVQAAKRLWLSASASYGSGLPAEVTDTNLADLEAQYSPQILQRVNLSRNRVRPSFALSFSGGATLWQHELRSLSLQADLFNATNRLNLINFASLFSGTAIAPPRSGSAHVTFSF
jgi:outer membrane cobalamin receptor